MSLPFLQKKKVAGVIMSRRRPDGSKIEISHDDSDNHPELKRCMDDMLSAIKNNSPEDMAKALQKAFEHLEKEPHEEGPHKKPEPHSYDAQNERSGE